MSYSKEQITAALLLFDKTGSPAKVKELLGYPSISMLYLWKEWYPDLYKRQGKQWKHASLDLKMDAIRRCYYDGESIESVSRDIGYTPAAIKYWKRKYAKEGALSFMKKPDTKKTIPDNDSAAEIAALKAQIEDMQMDIDILRETINVLKKDPGLDQTALKNREKAVIIDALKNKYSLPKLCSRLAISKSSYYYQESVLKTSDKYAAIRQHIRYLFYKNRRTFGYRKIYLLLKNENITLSEKVIRRIMKEEGLIVKNKKRRKYNSYLGEISPAVPNEINRNFHADKPNEKWLTDITEFSIKAGKVYLSPIIDCFDGMPVAWTIGTHPNAELVNTMLKQALKTLNAEEKPVIHSDRGCHYRWPEWIELTKTYGLKRSMSQKGCSPDNSACEGFFGHLKVEMFYGYNWDEYTIDEFIQEVDDYMRWYREERIKATLGGLSPLDYRRSMCVTV